jgi:hypothetical protein
MLLVLSLKLAWIDPVMNTPLERTLQIVDSKNGTVIWQADLIEVADETDPEASKYFDSVPIFHGLLVDGNYCLKNVKFFTSALSLGHWQPNLLKFYSRITTNSQQLVIIHEIILSTSMSDCFAERSTRKAPSYCVAMAVSSVDYRLVRVFLLCQWNCQPQWSLFFFRSKEAKVRMMVAFRVIGIMTSKFHYRKWCRERSYLRLLW